MHEYKPLRSRLTLVSVVAPFTSGTKLFFESLNMAVAGGLAAVTLHSIIALWFSIIMFGVTVKLSSGSTKEERITVCIAYSCIDEQIACFLCCEEKIQQGNFTSINCCLCVRL